MSANVSGLDAALAVARSSWVRAGKDRRVPLVIVVLPVMIMLVIGTVFGVDDRSAVGIVDRDGGRRAADLIAMIEGGGELRVRTYTSEDRMRSELRRARVLAGLVIPPGYSARLDRGEPAVVRAVSQPGRGEAVFARANLARAVGRQSLELIVERSTGQEIARPKDGGYAQTRYGRAPSDISPFSYTAPSNLVLFVFITSLVFGSGLVASRQVGALRRMLVTPSPARAIVAGLAVSAFTVALVQAVGLLLIGSVFFRVRWGDPIAVVLLVLALALVGAALNMLMGTLARTPEQAVTIAVPLGIAMGMLGGCMWPLEAVSPGMRAVGHLTPHAWAMDAWMRLIFAGQALADVARQLVVLVGFAVVLFPVATWRVRRLLLRP